MVFEGAKKPASMGMVGLGLLMGSVLGCGEGSLRVRFSWPETGRPDQGALYLRVQGPGDEPLNEVGPVALRPNLRLRFATVPYGESRQVVAEVRRAAFSNASVFLRAQSRPFDLRRGDSVELALRFEPVEDPVEEGPASPDISQLIQIRVPWGSVDTGGVPSLRVQGAPGAVAEGVAVVLLDRPNVEEALELGRAAVAEDGSFDAELRFDLATPAALYAAALTSDDRLSDASEAPGLQASRVSRVRWRATLAGKIPGQSFPNPHQIRTDPLLDVLRPDPLGAAESPGAPVAIPDDGLIIEVQPAARWQLASAPPPPDAERSVVLSTNHESGELTLLDGAYSTYLYRFNGETWVLASPESGARPEARTFTGAAWDEGRKTLVLFGGFRRGLEGAVDSLWEFDGRSWKRIPFDFGPGPRSGHNLVYDPLRQEVLLVGGSLDDSDGDLFEETSEVWSWNGERWLDLTPAGRGRAPLFRSFASSFDRNRGRLVVASGGFSQDLDEDSVWEWTGSAWEDRPGFFSVPDEPPGPNPHPQIRSSYDANRGRVLVFESQRDDDFAIQVFSWDGTNFRRILASGAPTGRVNAVGFHPPTGCHVVLVEPLDGTESPWWTFCGTQWRPTAPSPGDVPAGRSAHSLTETGNGAVLMVGGFEDADRPSYLGDAWSWDGQNWTREPAGPGPRAFHSAAFNPDTQQVVLFGGVAGERDLSQAFDDTWIFEDGGWIRWEDHGSPRPLARYAAQMAYDAGAGGLVLTGGVSESGVLLQDTWLFADGGWEVLSGVTMWPRAFAPAATDPNSGEARLLGGAVLSGNSMGFRQRPDGFQASILGWDAQESAWQPVASMPNALRPLFGPAVATAPDRGGILFFGGGLAEFTVPSFSETWLLDDDGWTQLGLAQERSPGARMYAGMAFDSVRQRTVLVGGRVLEWAPIPDVWEFGLAADDEAAIQVDFTPPSEATLLEDVRFRMDCRRANGGPSEDVSPQAFDGLSRAWVPVESIQDPNRYVDAPQGPSGPEASRLMRFRCVAEGGLQVDYVELELTYTLPL